MIGRLAAALFISIGAGAALAQPVSPYGLLQCTNSTFYDASTAGATQLVAALAGARIYVCGYTIDVGATATNISLVYGTGTNCATGQTGLTPVWNLPINGFMVDNIAAAPLVAPPGQALCVLSSAANPAKVLVRYLQQ
jgi:hypothetical protein